MRNKDTGIPTLKAEDLDDRQIDGLLLFRSILAGNTCRVPIGDAHALYPSTKDPEIAYTVERVVRNRRGRTHVECRCSCPDNAKQGRRDCQHRFAEKLLRGDLVVTGDVDPTLMAERSRIVAGRRPARQRFSHDGRSIRSAQRTARVKMATELPRLILSLKRAWDHKERSDAAS